MVLVRLEKGPSNYPTSGTGSAEDMICDMEPGIVPTEVVITSSEAKRLPSRRDQGPIEV